MPWPPRVIRSDVLKDRKCIHIQLEKTTHAQLRVLMFKYNLSMQEVFGEFANMIVSEENLAARVIERVADRKVRDSLEGKKRSGQGVDELDSDALYDLIESRGKNRE